MFQKAEHIDLIRRHLPPYLTGDNAENLVKLIERYFPLSHVSSIYTMLNSETFFQGDIFEDIPFSLFNADKGQFETVFTSGILLSNTCDIYPENERMENINFTFAMIEDLGEFIIELQRNGISQKRIIAFRENLQNNRISHLLHLPPVERKGQIILKESFVRFDKLNWLPSSLFFGTAPVYSNNYLNGGDRVASFTNYGFYLFLVKLSVHFCRIREGLDRTAA